MWQSRVLKLGVQPQKQRRGGGVGESKDFFYHRGIYILSAGLTKRVSQREEHDDGQKEDLADV